MSKQRKTVASTYLYDPLDRLAASNSIQRFYNDTRIATEIEGERKSRFFETDSQPLALHQHGNLPGTTLLATDQQTSVLNGVSPEGTLHAQAYSPFGHHPIGTSLNGAGFNGERPEPLTGHYLLGQGYRAFNPVLMRFNSPDSWSPFGDGGINAYAYCDNDPLNKVDPTGHIPNFFKGFRNMFMGRVPSHLRTPNKTSTTLAPTLQRATTPTTLPMNSRLTPDEFGGAIPLSTADSTKDITLRAARKFDRLLNRLEIPKPTLSLKNLGAKQVPDSQLLNFKTHTKNILGKDLRSQILPELKRDFNALADIDAKRGFLQLLHLSNPTTYNALPHSLLKVIRME